MAVIGTRSAILLPREPAYGTSRFDDIARRTGLTEAVAAPRLKELVDHLRLRKEPHQEPRQRTRQAYVLTKTGRDLVPALVALAAWGSKHAPRRGTPRFSDDGCGEPVAAVLQCAARHELDEAELIVTA